MFPFPTISHFLQKYYLLSLHLNEWEATLLGDTFGGIKRYVRAYYTHVCSMNYRKNNVILHCTCLNNQMIYYIFSKMFKIFLHFYNDQNNPVSNTIVSYINDPFLLIIRLAQTFG